MNRIKIHPMTVRDQEFDVYVTSSGRFEAELDGKTLTDFTREGLHAELMRATKRKTISVSVEFETMDIAGNIRRGTATGIHSGTSNILVRWADGGTSQESGISPALRPLSAEEREQWQRLHAATVEARTNMREFTSGKEVDVRRRVRDEIDLAMKQ